MGCRGSAEPGLSPSPSPPGQGPRFLQRLGLGSVCLVWFGASEQSVLVVGGAVSVLLVGSEAAVPSSV